jgi:hypothetical protein
MSDQYSKYTQLLMHAATDFSDSASIPKTITPYGNAQISNGWAVFDGTGDYLTVDSSIWGTIGTGDFTIEFYLNATAFDTSNGFGSGLVDTRSSSLGFIILANNSGVLTIYEQGGTTHATSSGIIPLNTSVHIATSRISGTQYIFVNGTNVLQYASAYNHTGTALTIGSVVDYRNSGTGYKLTGKMRELRITVGAGRYSTNFTPPTIPLDNPDAVQFVFGQHYQCDPRFGGRYSITGTVTELGVVGAYKVRLYDRMSGKLVQETWSGSAGTYAFNYLAYPTDYYFVVAHDRGANQLNAAIADLITPSRM